jgi:cytochrome b subunit of formate dehydrogenase
MFNPGQKLLAWALTASVTAVVATGIQAWSAHTGEGNLHGAAVLLTALLLSAHVFMAVLNPATQPALASMAFGRVPRSWAAEQQGAVLIHRQLGITDNPRPPDVRSPKADPLAKTIGAASG